MHNPDLGVFWILRRNFRVNTQRFRKCKAKFGIYFF